MSEHEHKHSSHKSAKRQRIVLTVLIIGGVALMAVLISPFLLELVSGHRSQTAPSYSEDAEKLTERETLIEKPLAAQRMWRGWRPVYDNFDGVKLGSTREEIGKKYPLHLKGRANAVPAVYECTNRSPVIKFRGSFYDNQLKDFTVVMGPFRDGVVQVKEQLFKGLGEGPRYRIGETDAGMRVGLSDPDLMPFLSAFQHAEALTWGDGSNRVDATLYSAVTVSNQPVTALAVRVSATTWLEDYQQKAQAGMAVQLKEEKKSSDSSAP